MVEAARAEPTIAHLDREILVLDKPPGLATTAPGGGDSLFEAARRLDPAAPHLHPTSRLDAEVSGLVTFARTRAANRLLMRARRTGRYRRLYVGLCAGALAAPAGEWSAAIGLDPDDRRLRRVAPTSEPGARPSLTRWEVAATASGVALLRLFPRTGRTHQLRVHAAHAGAPLLGDVAYGGPRRVVLPDGQVVTARRVLLHCAAIGLPGLGGIGARELRAPVPEDLARVWRALGGDAALLDRASRLP